MNLENYLNSFIDESLNNLSYHKVIRLCEAIIDEKYIKGLDKYPRELLALELEKQIMMSIEIDSNIDGSFFDKLKMKKPFLFKNKELLKENIELFIDSRDLLKSKKNETKNVRKFYNDVILKRSYMRSNKLVTLPGGEKVSLKEIALAINNTLKIPKEIHFNVKYTGKKAKKATLIGAVISATTIALVFGKYRNEELSNNILTEITADISNDSFGLPQAGVSAYITNSKYDKVSMVELENTMKYDVTSSNSNEVETRKFLGYEVDVGDEEKNKEIFIKQKYLYDLCKEQGVDFNNAMTIWHIESGGKFNNNGIENSTHDLGEMQINECNLEYLNDVFELVKKKDNEQRIDIALIKEVIKNDWQKNMKAAVYLIKAREEMYEKNDFANIFGCYNGWKNWKEKPISIEYSKKAIDLRVNKYNKNEEELFVLFNDMEELNAKGL